MSDRKVTHTGKDSDGDITKLCNHGAWGYVTRVQAIQDIESHTNSYYVQQPGTNRVEVNVVTRGGKKHLQTTPDSSSANNLDNLPNC